MKLGIVGTGFVGATAAYALVMRGHGSELVLVDANAERAKAEAEDLLHAVPFAEPMRVYAGSYADLAGSTIVIIAAGVNQKPGETRLQLLERNATIFAQVVPSILQHAPDAMLIVATNPVDVMTHLTARYAQQFGVPSTRIIGSGTTLDTARFRSLLARHVAVSSQHVHGYVIGEHGDSEVLVWSQAMVGVIPLEDYCRIQNIPLNQQIKDEIDRNVRRAAYNIIGGKGATYYGIGSALARLVDIILSDEHAIMTICTPTADIAGVKDVTVALPHLIGGKGVLATLPMPLTDDEQAKLHSSAALIRGIIDDLYQKLDTAQP